MNNYEIMKYKYTLILILQRNILQSDNKASVMENKTIAKRKVYTKTCLHQSSAIKRNFYDNMTPK
jgi:hypothetical protein